jgi:FMN reductase
MFATDMLHLLWLRAGAANAPGIASCYFNPKMYGTRLRTHQRLHHGKQVDPSLMSTAGNPSPAIRIIAFGGTLTPGSSTSKALDIACRSAESAGAIITRFGFEEFRQLPFYLTVPSAEVPVARRFIQALREAEGVLIASPGWHGSVPGLLKNALDYLEDMAQDDPPYLDGRAVGLIATAYGNQAACSTLNALRTIVHALRGWPTPLGAAVNCSGGIFRDGTCSDEAILRQLQTIGVQVVEFAKMQRLARIAHRATAPESRSTP